MTFSYRNSFKSISNISQYPKDDPLIKYSDEVKNSYGYTIEKVYLNFMGMPMVVCRRDGVNVMVPPESIDPAKIIGNKKDCFVILTYHRFGRQMSKEKCFFNRYIIPPDMSNDKIKTYANDLDELSFTEDIFGSYEPKMSNVIMQNTVITLDMVNSCEGAFYSFDEDISIARYDAVDMQIHPFYYGSKCEYVDYNKEDNNTGIGIVLNDTQHQFPDMVYYMIGNLPCKIMVNRDCLQPNGLHITYTDSYSKKVTSHHYPIEEIIDGSYGEKIDYKMPIIYRSRSDAINYGKGDEILKNIVSKMKLDLEKAKNNAAQEKLEYDERMLHLEMEKAKFDESVKKIQYELKMKQEDQEYKFKMEETRLKQQREDVLIKEKQQSEHWKGIIAFATGIVGLLVLVMKK